jgi:hypothetical protein
MEEEGLPPGFRFHPTDEELITYYLTHKVSDFAFTTRAIADVDLNKCEPWDLPSKNRSYYYHGFFDPSIKAVCPPLQLLASIGICSSLSHTNSYAASLLAASEREQPNAPGDYNIACLFVPESLVLRQELLCALLSQNLFFYI